MVHFVHPAEVTVGSNTTVPNRESFEGSEDTVTRVPRACCLLAEMPASSSKVMPLLRRLCVFFTSFSAVPSTVSA